MSKSKVVILGINGHIGRAAAEAFVAAGWDVAGMARTDKAGVPGVRFVRGDSDSVEDMRRAIGDAEVVVNALNLPYHQWDKGRMEAQMGRVAEALGQSGKTMLFPGNIYNFSRADRELTPELVQRPETPRGEIRMRVEQMFEAAAARGDMQVIILRGGDFYGPGSSGDWFDQAILSAKGKVQMMGAPEVGHSWAYLPDLARAFEALASLRKTLGPFERFHFAGNFVTGEQMAAAIVKAAPVTLKVSRFPLGLLRLLGLFSPMLREVSKMGYIWRHPMELRDSRLDALLGPDFSTPFEMAVAATVTPVLAGESAAPPELKVALRV